MLYFSPDIYLLHMESFFSSYCEYIVSWGYWPTKKLFVIKPEPSLNTDLSYSKAKDRFYGRLCHRHFHCYL